MMINYVNRFWPLLNITFSSVKKYHQMSRTDETANIIIIKNGTFNIFPPYIADTEIVSVLHKVHNVGKPIRIQVAVEFCFPIFFFLFLFLFEYT